MGGSGECQRRSDGVKTQAGAGGGLFRDLVQRLMRVEAAASKLVCSAGHDVIPLERH